MLLFVAVHESESGTKRTNRGGLAMSVDRGRPEVADRRSERRTRSGHRPRRLEIEPEVGLTHQVLAITIG
jgi:hypothetical protein